ncbi:glycosyl transferase, partial [Escherichia coli]|nr:glycosyl transferase [Escherichia coli]
HEKSPATIDKFYPPKYYDRLQKIIISVISRRK